MGGEFGDSSRRARRVSRGLQTALTDLGGVLLPTECVGCGAWDKMVCDRYLAQTLGEPQALDPGLAGIPGFAVMSYEGAMRRSVLVGRHDLRLDSWSYSTAVGKNTAVLAARLGVMKCHREVFAVPAPSTTPEASSPVVGTFATDIMSRLVEFGVTSQSGVLEILEIRPGIKKQAGSGYSQRVTNRHHRIALIALGAGSELSGVTAVLVDGAGATGSALREMARALQDMRTEILGGSVFATNQFSQQQPEIHRRSRRLMK